MKSLIVTTCLIIASTLALRAGEESPSVATARQMLAIDVIVNGFDAVPDEWKKDAIKVVGGPAGDVFVSKDTAAILILSEGKKGFITALILFPKLPSSENILKLLNNKGFPGKFTADGPVGKIKKGLENKQENVVYSVTVDAEKLTPKDIESLKTVFSVNELTKKLTK